jgi:hypothetical protein
MVNKDTGILYFIFGVVGATLNSWNRTSTPRSQIGYSASKLCPEKIKNKPGV